MADCNIINSIIIGVLSGIISSLIVWMLLNVISIPRIQIDDEIQYGKRKNYLRIYNKSWLDVFEVVYSVEYQFSDGSYFFRTANPIPNLKRKEGRGTIPLGRNTSTMQSKNNSKTDAFFLQSKGTIVVTITYQNRFGVKRTCKPKKIEYIKESIDNIYE